MRSFVIILCVCITMASATSAQDREKITPAESQKAEAFAKQFAKDLLEIKDFTPLFPRYFLSSFETTLPNDSLHFLPDEAKRTPHMQQNLSRFAAAEWNFEYLLMLFQLTKGGPNNVDEKDPISALPADIKSIIAGQKDTWDKLQAFDETKPTEMSPSESEFYFDSTLHLLISVNDKLRSHLSDVTTKDPKAKDILSSQPMNAYKTFDPWVYTCDRSCYFDFHFPKGTRLVIVDMNFLQQLILVPDKNGDYKVAAVLFGD